MLRDIVSSDTLAQHLFEEAKVPKAETDSFIIFTKLKNYPLELKISYRDGGPVTKGAFCRSVAQARKRLYGDIFHILFHAYIGSIDIESLRKILAILEEARTEYNKMTEERQREFRAALSQAILFLLT